MAVDGEPSLELGLQDWIAVVAHDLRDPINAILGTTDLLLATALSPEQREHAEVVQDAATSLLSLVNDLLDVNRLERGQLRFADRPFEVRDLVRHVVGWLVPRAEAQTVELRFDVAASVPAWLSGDPGRLRQILANLVGNAVKFTREGAVVVTVDVAEPGTLIRFRVQDSGRGMDPAVLARIGTPFTQGRGSDGADGVGLGVAIAKHLVHAMGGEMTLASTAGVGTEVTLLLPLRPAPAPSRAPATALCGQRVFLVASGPSAVDVEQRLQLMGLRVERVADSAAVGMRLASDLAAPAAVLMICDRIEAARAAELARWRALAPGLPVLALVRSGVRGEAEVAHHAGFDGYLPAGLDSEVLERALRRVMTGAPRDGASFVTVHGLREERAGPWRLLVVDDNPMNLRLMQLLLSRAGHDVEMAEDGETALARVERGGLDAVLLDIQMPGMSGLEVTRAVRARGELRLPIIAVTAHAMPDMIDRCRDAGMNGYVTKPIDPEGVVEAIRQALADRGAGRPG